MKALKRLALRALLSKEQRAVIMNSVAYSEHKYRVHSDVDGAIRVGIIRKELEHVISVPEPKFTKTQVDRIVKAVLCDFADWLRKKEGKTCVAVGTVVEKEKCDKCEHRDECEVRKALFNDADDKGNGTEGETLLMPRNHLSRAQILPKRITLKRQLNVSVEMRFALIATPRLAVVSMRSVLVTFVLLTWATSQGRLRQRKSTMAQ